MQASSMKAGELAWMAGSYSVSIATSQIAEQ